MKPLTVALSLLAAFTGPRALAKGDKYQAPDVKLESKKVGGHRMVRDEDGPSHAQRYKVQETPDPERGVASDKEGATTRDPSSESAPKKARKGARMPYWHVTK